ncbi:MAG: GtrA family protein [Tannerella sp.]|nr:GtrA family protein [Tannerella sp.]
MVAERESEDKPLCCKFAGFYGCRDVKLRPKPAVWTFESENSNIAGEYMSFVIIALLGLLLNNGVVWLLSNRLQMNFYGAKLIAVAVVTLWNFGMNYYFTF